MEPSGISSIRDPFVIRSKLLPGYNPNSSQMALGIASWYLPKRVTVVIFTHSVSIMRIKIYSTVGSATSGADTG